MTATFQDYCLAKQGHELFQARDEMAPTRRSVNPAAIANDIEGRYMNLSTRPWCNQVPIGIMVRDTGSSTGELPDRANNVVLIALWTYFSSSASATPGVWKYS